MKLTPKRENLSQEIYLQLENLALPLIEAYHADLTTHDKNVITANPGTPFLHFTGNSGTYLVLMFPAEHSSWPAHGEIIPYLFGRADRWHILKGCQVTVEYAVLRPDSDRRKLALHCDGRRIRKITLEKAHEIILEYIRRVEKTWRRELIA